VNPPASRKQELTTITRRPRHGVDDSTANSDYLPALMPGQSMAIWRIPVMLRPLRLVACDGQVVFGTDRPGQQVFQHGTRLCRRFRLLEQVGQFVRIFGQIVKFTIAHHVVKQLPVAFSQHFQIAALCHRIEFIECDLRARRRDLAYRVRHVIARVVVHASESDFAVDALKFFGRVFCAS
jgi:hypothetical protein